VDCQAYAVDHHFDEVITNPTELEPSGRVRVRPRTPADMPHRCPRCNANLCKGTELDALLAARGHIYERIVYVGDGPNDVCPTLRFARYGPRDGARERYRHRSTLTTAPHRDDVVLARRGRKFLQYWEARLREPPAPVSGATLRPVADTARHADHPTVLPWDTGEDVLAHFERLLPPMAPAAAL
jgi:hypothetical protein